MGGRKTVDGAYRYRYAPFLVLSWLSLWESCRRRRLRGFCRHIWRVPSPSSLRSATSPRGRGKRLPRLAIPPGELSPQATERVLQAQSAVTLSDLASLGHLSQGERQECPYLALPLGELSPQATERVLQARSAYPLRPRFAQPPLPRGEASQPSCFKARTKAARSGEWKKALPATRTFAPASMQRFAVCGLMPPSTSISQAGLWASR